MTATDSTLCMCQLQEHPSYAGHTGSDHESERCSGSWTFDPPCGGCINCDLARAVYYERGGEG